MNFNTKVEILPFENKISHKHKILLIGSCFTESISDKLKNSKFSTYCNPFGVVYNPVSIFNCFEILKNQKRFTESDIFFENGVWKSFYHHSSFSKTNKTETLKNINTKISESYNYLKSANYVFITIGTSLIYEHIPQKIVVSNCHKVASSNFKIKLLSVEEATISLTNIIKNIYEINKDIKIIFTISPIRHLKDGLHKNNVSKAILFAALNNVQNNNSEIYYFPSYEILIDELRDYRFYAEDLLHPSKVAIDYIWEVFCCTFFNIETTDLIKKIAEIKNAVNHIPFFPESSEHKTFKKRYYLTVCKLSEKYSFIDFNFEKEFLKNL